MESNVSVNIFPFELDSKGFRVFIATKARRATPTVTVHSGLNSRHTLAAVDSHGETHNVRAMRMITAILTSMCTHVRGGCQSNGLAVIPEAIVRRQAGLTDARWCRCVHTRRKAPCAIAIIHDGAYNGLRVTINVHFRIRWREQRRLGGRWGQPPGSSRGTAQRTLVCRGWIRGHAGWWTFLPVPCGCREQLRRPCWRRVWHRRLETLVLLVRRLRGEAGAGWAIKPIPRHVRTTSDGRRGRWWQRCGWQHGR